MNTKEAQRALTQLYAAYSESDLDLSAAIVPALQDALASIADRKHCSKKEAIAFLELYMQEARVRFLQRKKHSR